MLKKPQPLKPGDTIGIAAPAGSFDPVDLKTGIGILEHCGFKVFTPKGLFEQKGYLAGSDAHRHRVFEELILDPSIRAIMFARGGFGSMRVIPFLDVETIRRYPKHLIGFSDITALLTFFQSKCGWVVFHGPVVKTISASDDETVLSLRNCLISGKMEDICCDDGTTVNSGQAVGQLIGGNLTTLNHLLGTRYQVDFSDRILFFEDIGEPPYKIDRMLFQMKLAGCFQRIRGLILGTFSDCGPMEDILKIIRNIFRDNNIPILSGLAAGHGRRNLTIPIGVPVELDADGKQISFSSEKYHETS